MGLQEARFWTDIPVLALELGANTISAGFRAGETAAERTILVARPAPAQFSDAAHAHPPERTPPMFFDEQPEILDPEKKDEFDKGLLAVVDQRPTDYFSRLGSSTAKKITKFRLTPFPSVLAPEPC